MTRVPRLNGKLLALKDAEAYTGLPYHTLWQLVTEGALPQVKLPHRRCIYVSRAALDAFIEAHTTEARR
jgi:predicted DNA-binding transcriptional regulator AlpA